MSTTDTKRNAKPTPMLVAVYYRRSGQVIRTTPADALEGLKNGSYGKLQAIGETTEEKRPENQSETGTYTAQADPKYVADHFKDVLANAKARLAREAEAERLATIGESLYLQLKAANEEGES